MQKLRPVIYMFILLIIFSIIWIIISQTQSQSTLDTHFLIFFSKQNKVLTEETTIPTTLQISTTDSFDAKQQPPGDYTRLVNLNNFEFLLSVECTSNDKYPSLLIAVHTAPGNVEKRQVIRETWGMKRPETKLVFMMGEPKEQEEKNIVAVEHGKYNDIVQGNFMDTYKNLSYKHVMVLKYTVYHCPEIKYLLKTDDDVFINMPTAITYIHEYNIVKTRELLFCIPMFGSPAIREESKWKITYEEFPDKFYPPYCAGFAILYSPDTVHRIYRGAQISKFLWVDDAFVTGVAREAAKVNITPLSTTLYLKYNEMDTIFRINNTYPLITYPFLLGPANIQPKDVRKLWYIVTHQKTK